MLDAFDDALSLEKPSAFGKMLDDSNDESNAFTRILNGSGEESNAFGSVSSRLAIEGNALPSNGAALGTKANALGVEARAINTMPGAFGIDANALGNLPGPPEARVGASNSMTSAPVVELDPLGNAPEHLAFEAEGFATNEILFRNGTNALSIEASGSKSINHAFRWRSEHPRTTFDAIRIETQCHRYSAPRARQPGARTAQGFARPASSRIPPAKSVAGPQATGTGFGSRVVASSLPGTRLTPCSFRAGGAPYHVPRRRPVVAG